MSHTRSLVAALAALGAVASLHASPAHAGLASSPLGVEMPDGLVCQGIATSPLGVVGRDRVAVHGGLGSAPLGIAPDGPIVEPPVLRGLGGTALGILVSVPQPDGPPVLAVVSPRDACLPEHVELDADAIGDPGDGGPRLVRFVIDAAAGTVLTVFEAERGGERVRLPIVWELAPEATRCGE